MERVLLKTPTGESLDGSTVCLPISRAREELFDRFVALLAEDRTTYAEDLDFFEIRFDAALKCMRHDAQRKVWREQKGVSSIEADPETGEIDPKVERELSFDPFDPVEMQRADYRSRLVEAIKSLPNEQRTIVEMIGKNIPIDSTKPNAVTIAKTLGKSEKTIRLHRDQAYAALKDMLKSGKVL